ncbi:nucleoside hydrolase [Curtobacterium sp. RRHDQ10]|uniref:nucleoside hydrolase n=1 Tax=Curtobacterium phyllosphaerae TaxID=3413379 RepID=UPI003BF2B62B
MTNPTRPTPVFLDCDTGIDDALALAWLTGRPGIDLVGVGVVSGNVDAPRAGRNTLDLLAVLGNDRTPVAVGPTDFWSRPFHGGAPHVHGRNGIGDVELPTTDREVEDESAAELLVRLSHEHAGALRVLAIGPLTNLAHALRLDPTLPSRVEDVTVMGGAFLVRGNVSPLAEANIHNDPEAADLVYAAPWDVTTVPLDVTTGHRFTEEHITALADSGSGAAQHIGRMLDVYADFYATVYQDRVAILHDPLAAAVMTGDLEVTASLHLPVHVIGGDGPDRGVTKVELPVRATPERRAGTVVLAVDRPFADLLAAHVAGLPDAGLPVAGEATRP